MPRIARPQPLIGLIVLGLFVSAAGQSSIRPEPLKILFIGNSYTYYNGLPAHLERLIDSHPGNPAVEVASITPGGASLGRHASNPETLEAIRSGGWTHVVLQEQSQRPRHYVHGRTKNLPRRIRACRGMSSVSRPSPNRFEHR